MRQHERDQVHRARVSEGHVAVGVVLAITVPIILRLVFNLHHLYEQASAALPF